MAIESGRNDLDGWLESRKSDNMSGSLHPDIKRKLLSLASDHAALPCVGTIQDAVQQPLLQVSPTGYSAHVRDGAMNPNKSMHIDKKMQADCGIPHSNDEEDIPTATQIEVK